MTRLLPIEHCYECLYQCNVWSVGTYCCHDDAPEEAELIGGEGIPEWCPLERDPTCARKDECRFCGVKLEAEKINNICKDCYWKGRDRK